MSVMTIVSVNVAGPEHVVLNGRDFYTAIGKLPVPGPTAVGPMGLEGDAVGSPKHHGGRDQAVYIYGTTDYEWWEEKLEWQLEPGTFGENLTVAGLASADLVIGDRLHVGDTVVLEVSAPRIPCGTLAARMGDGTFVEKFRAARRPGAYTRVIEAGTVSPGDAIMLQTAERRDFTLLDMFDLAYDRSAPLSAFRRGLEAPIAERARLTYQRTVAR